MHGGDLRMSETECTDCFNAIIESFTDRRGVIHRFCKNCGAKWIENDGGKPIYGGSFATEKRNVFKG